MVIARATTHAGKEMLVIGLSKENRKRLDSGQPIDISTHTHGEGIPEHLHLVIFGGIDEDTMQDDLRALIGPDTVVRPLQRQGGA
jgi:hypothetical protein